MVVFILKMYCIYLENKIFNNYHKPVGNYVENENFDCFGNTFLF